GRGWKAGAGARRRAPPTSRSPSPISSGCSAGAEPVSAFLAAAGDRLGEILIFLALGAADSRDRPELRLGAGHIALNDIGLAKILAHLSIAGSELYRFQVVADPLIDAAELAGRVAAIVERFGSIGVLHQVEDFKGLAIAIGLGEDVGILGKRLVRQHAGLPADAAHRPRIVDFAGLAGA